MTQESDWTPPADPDPRTIDREAHEDRRAGRYADALAKRMWYHRHVAELNRHLDASRLSFGIGYWHDLGKEYPPAMEAMRAERDAAEHRALDDPHDQRAFSEFVAFNRAMEERGRTVVAFAEISARDPAAAAELYRRAEPALIAAERYDLCSPYLDPERRLESAASFYSLCGTEITPDSVSFSPDAKIRGRYLNDVGTLLALLTRTGRRAEAEGLAPRIREVVQGDDAEAVIGAALEGRFPPDAARG